MAYFDLVSKNVSQVAALYTTLFMSTRKSTEVISSFKVCLGNSSVLFLLRSVGFCIENLGIYPLRILPINLKHFYHENFQVNQILKLVLLLSNLCYEISFYCIRCMFTSYLWLILTYICKKVVYPDIRNIVLHILHKIALICLISFDANID